LASTLEMSRVITARMRQFVGIDLGREPVPDETTVCKFRHLLEEHDCATWLHKARSLPKDQFKQEVEKELTGRESEPWEII
jgi:IS5 family transposase